MTALKRKDSEKKKGLDDWLSTGQWAAVLSEHHHPRNDDKLSKAGHIMQTVTAKGTYSCSHSSTIS